MRTNPPGEEREEGEGKKPKVVGEPGGLEKERGRAQTDCYHKKYLKKQTE